MKILRLLLILISYIFISNHVLFSQEKVRIQRSEFRVKEDGFKEAWKAIRKGNRKYRSGVSTYRFVNKPNFGTETFRFARDFYLDAYKYNEKNAELNYKIGVCYLYSDDKLMAIKYLKKAFELNPSVADDIHLQLARAYHMSYDFSNAEKEYSAFKSSISERKLRKLNLNIDKYIEECETGKSLVKQPQKVVIQDLGKFVNSEFDDYYPVIDSKEETMYFTSRRPGMKNTKKNFYDKKFSEDIYMLKKRGKDWGIAQLLSKKLTTKRNEAALALSPNDSVLYVFKSKRRGNIYYSRLDDGKWRGLKSLRKVNSRFCETSMCISSDGSRLYFVSNREKTSIGGKDVYVCEKQSNGKWGNPMNIGAPVNTPDNEEGISLSRDGKTLYFSSKGHASMGGYDIFSSTLGDNGIWSNPVNLGYPVNTPDDDLFFSMMGNGKVAYMSSNREQGIGGKDIYKLVFLGAEKELVILKDNSPFAFELYDPKTLFKKIPDYFTVDSSIILTGRVLDSDTKTGIIAKLQFIDSEKSSVVATLISDSTGSYKTRLPEKKIYGVEITAKGYLFFLDVIDIKKVKTDIVNKDFFLDKLEVGAKVVLKNIFFETAKATLKEESFQQLNTVVEFMKDNSTLKLEISGHTDNVGGLAYNKKLSENRAKAVVTYLVSQGIDASRLTFVGYGPNQPVAKNTTAAGKAQNRRVEFKITGK
jgi:tetratricopeptide (TPR) repeat protein